MTEVTRRNPDSATGPAGYDPAVVEKKWQTRWEERGTNNTDLSAGARPFYALMMFPYPSAEGLHVGNLFAFTGNDIYGRFQRLKGHTVFEPLGYDAFGIHSENFAIKVGVHPADLIPRNIDNFRRQLKRAGLMVDWTHELSTTDPRYYKWTQWVFLQLCEQGLAYKKKAAVNWCPFDKTVLANEQVVGGVCERCGTPVEQRFLEQWFFRITDYAGRLLANLDRLDWSESTLTAQRNWIGKSEGAELVFPVQDVMAYAGSATVNAGMSGETTATPLEIRVFTTRPDTVFGATYLVLAPEHPLVSQIVADEQRQAVDAYVARAVVNYRLHDWCISRQRYWGPPIPIVYCDECGVVPVPEAQLPVVLPEIEDFRPDDSGVSPLARHEEWYHTPCPQCGARARRETDVSDTFLDSAWYFLRYPSSDRDDVPFDPELTKKWLPVHSYIGGNEHAVLHLLYSRFITMVLHDMGHLTFEEPYTRFRAHGL